MNLRKFININWYMDRKPYSPHTEHDVFYLKICRDLFTIIKNQVSRYGSYIRLGDEDLRELAYILIAYFEDKTNGIGFWDSLTALHIKQFGKRLPFFEKEVLNKEEEDYFDIFPTDIYYLLFVSYFIQSTTREEGKPLIAFEDSFFRELAMLIFTYLDEIEEVSETEFYESYLIPTKDYFKLKGKLHWFVFNSYLTRIEFSQKIQDFFARQEERGENAPQYLYAEEDRLMCEEPSSFSAFYPLDILAGAMRCNERVKEELAGLKLRPYGIFNVQNKTSTHLHFVHTATGEEFEVSKESVNNPLALEKQGNQWLAKLALWGGNVWISGMTTSIPLPAEELEKTNQEEQHLFQKHFAPYREKVFKAVSNYQKNALDFFKTAIVAFDSGSALQEKLNEFSHWQFQKACEKKEVNKKAEPAKVNLPKDLLKSSDIVLFIPTANSLNLVIGQKKYLPALLEDESKAISMDEISNAVLWFLDESINKEYNLHLSEEYDLKNLSLFFPGAGTNKEDLEAMLRLYKPTEFSPLFLPAFKISGL